MLLYSSVNHTEQESVEPTVISSVLFFTKIMERRDYVNNYNLKSGIAAKERLKMVHFIKSEPKYIYENEERQNGLLMRRLTFSRRMEPS